MNQNKLFVPISIVIAGLIIGGAIMFSNKSGSPTAPKVNNNGGPAEFSINPVDPAKDHIFGDPNADILIVEYSDFECPFCAQFHPTMERIMEEYGDQGKVAWVFRHFPLRSIHPRAQITSEASECAANIGGNDAFWKFSKEVFNARLDAMTKRDNALMEKALSDKSLVQYATTVGLNIEEFNSCLSSGSTSANVEEDYQDGVIVAQNDPNFGTPYSVVLTKDGIQTTIAGAQPYNTVKQIIDTILGE